MRKSIIVAASQNGVIGKDGKLPWHLPVDLLRFKVLTMGHTLIMGRKTYESLPPKVRPLPGRRTIGLTRCSPLSLLREHTGHDWCHSLSEAITLAYLNVNETEVFICGGGEIYREAFELCDRIYLTVVERDFEGDTRLTAKIGDRDPRHVSIPFWNIAPRGDAIAIGYMVAFAGARWRLAGLERGEEAGLPYRFENWERSR